jgi:hypothetical protein
MKKLFCILGTLVFMFTGCQKKQAGVKEAEPAAVQAKAEDVSAGKPAETIVETTTTAEETAADKAYNYAGGNGTILEQTAENGVETTYRKHEQQFSVTVYPQDTLVAYAEPDGGEGLFELENGAVIETSIVAFRRKTVDGSESNWLKIKDAQNRTGWLDMDTRWSPYADGTWAVLETIDAGGKQWTVRKLQQGLSTWQELDVLDKPVTGNVLFTLKGASNHQVGMTTAAITEETDTIDGKTDYWIKITDDEQGRTGWVFGSFTSRDMGGPKYGTPENRISFLFNLP